MAEQDIENGQRSGMEYSSGKSMVENVTKAVTASVSATNYD